MQKKNKQRKEQEKETASGRTSGAKKGGHRVISATANSGESRRPGRSMGTQQQQQQHQQQQQQQQRGKFYWVLLNFTGFLLIFFLPRARLI